MLLTFPETDELLTKNENKNVNITLTILYKIYMPLNYKNILQHA